MRAALEPGFVELPVHSEAAIHVAALPPHHRDPFDRLLIAQTLDETIRFYTADLCCHRIPSWSRLFGESGRAKGA